jgi:preprotein translocase subunit SecD
MDEQGDGQPQEQPPKKPHSNKRKRQYSVYVRLTAKEDAQLRAKAQKAGKRPGDLMRAWIEDKEIRAAHPEDYYRTLRNLGNNLNQIAKHLNSGALPLKNELEEVVRLCDEVHKNASC